MRFFAWKWKKIAEHKKENTQRFLGISWTRHCVGQASERRGKRGNREKYKREGRKVVAAVVDCGALTLAGHKAISKFHLF